MGRQARYNTYRYDAVAADPGFLRCLVLMVIWFNCLFAIMGAVMIGLGFYILLEEDFKMWVTDLEMQHYWNGVYILMTAGVLIMVQSFFGVCGAYQGRQKMLYGFFVMMFIVFLLEMVGAGYMLDNGIRYSKIEGWLRNKFMQLINDMDYSMKAARIMNIVQEYIGCCGADGVLDYVRWNKVIPATCYDPVDGNSWYKRGFGHMGCVRGMTQHLETLSGWIAGVALFSAFLQVFCLIAVCCLIKIKNDIKQQSTPVLNR